MKGPWIKEKDFHNFHWTKKISSQRGFMKSLKEKKFVRGILFVLFFLGRRGKK
jgi:hypothetical protein